MAEITTYLKTVDQGSEKFKKYQQSGSTAFNELKSSYIALTAAIYAGYRAFSGFTDTFTEFETGMAEVSTLVDTTQVNMKDFEDQIFEMGPRIGKGASDLSKGLYQVISAGIDTADSLDVLEVSAKAAVAGLTDTYTAVDAITTGLNAYGFAASEASRVSDILFTTVRLGKITFSELAQHIGKVLPFTSQLGISLEEVSGAIATLTASGLRPEIAMTGLRALTVSFLQQTKLWEKAGVDIVKVVDEEGIGGAMMRLQDITGGNKVAMMEFIPEVTALSAGLSLAGEGADAFARNTKEAMNATGATDIAFGKMSDTLDHLINVMMANVDKLLIKMGNQSLPVMTGAINTLIWTVEGLIVNLGDLETILITTGVAFVTMNLATMAGGLGIFSKLTAGAVLGVEILGGAVYALMTGAALTAPHIVALAVVAGALAWAFTEAAAGVMEFYDANSGITNMESGLAEYGVDVDLVTDSIEKMNNAARDMGNVLPEDIFKRQTKQLAELGFTGKGAMEAFNQALSQGLVEYSQNTKKFLTLAQKRGEVLKLEEEAVKAIEGAMKEYSSVIDSIGDDVLKMAGTDFTSNLKDQADSIGGMMQALEGYLAVTDEVYYARIQMLQVLDESMEKELQITEIELTQAETRLNSWSVYYNKLSTLHNATIEKQKQKVLELAQFEQQVTDRKSGYADLELSLMQKLMTESERYFSTQEDLEEKYRTASKLTGQAKIDALGEWQRAAASAAREIREGDEIVISSQEAVETALGQVAEAQKGIEAAEQAIIKAKQTEINQISIYQTKIEIAMTKASEMMEYYRGQVLNIGVEIASLNTDIALNVDNTQALSKINEVYAAIASIPEVTYKKIIIQTFTEASPIRPFTEGMEHIKSKMEALPKTSPYTIKVSNVSSETGGMLRNSGIVSTTTNNKNDSSVLSEQSITFSPVIQINGDNRSPAQLAKDIVRETEKILATRIKNKRSALSIN